MALYRLSSLSSPTSCPSAHAPGGPSAGLAGWGLGQDSPDHRAFALAAPPRPHHHSGLSLDVSSPDRSSWSKCYLFPYHITLQAILYDMADLKVAICPSCILWGPP